MGAENGAWPVADEDLDAYEAEIADLRADLARAQALVQQKQQRLLARLRGSAGVPADAKVRWTGAAFMAVEE